MVHQHVLDNVYNDSPLNEDNYMDLDITTMTKDQIKEQRKLRRAINKIERKQRKLDKSKNRLVNIRNNAVAILQRMDRFVTIDVENYEWNQNWIMEIGMSIFSRSTSPTSRHFIIAEHKNRFNKKYVEDNKYNFNFGESEIVNLPHAASIIRKEIHKGAIVVGHSMKLDTKALGVLDINVKYTMDTQKLYSVVSNNNATISLTNLLNHYDIKHKHLHNGGNDAHYTSQALRLLINDLNL